MKSAAPVHAVTHILRGSAFLRLASVQRQEWAGRGAAGPLEPIPDRPLLAPLVAKLPSVAKVN